MASVPQILEEMNYGTIEESCEQAEIWLSSHSPEGCIVPGCPMEAPVETLSEDVINPCTGVALAKVNLATDVDVEDAVSSATKASTGWLSIKNSRSRYMRKFALCLEVQGALIAQIEALTRGVQVKDPRGVDVPALVDFFRYYAGWSTCMAEFDEWQPFGVVASATYDNSPLLALAWLIAPALAAGNCVVLVVPCRFALPAMLLAKIWIDANCPPGVLSVLAGNTDTINKVMAHKDVTRVSCYGPTAFAREIRKELSLCPKRFTALMSGKTAMLVFESADLDSAAENAVKWAWFNQGSVPWAVRTIFVQESALPTFNALLRQRLDKIRLGNAFDKMADMGRPYDKEVVQSVARVVAEAKRNGVDVYQAELPEGLSAEDFFPPTVIVGSDGVLSYVITDEDLPPVLTLVTFRNVKEAITMANRSRYGFAASVWTENLSLGLECAEKLQVGTVWINAHGVINASIPVEGWKESGIGAFGGKPGLFDHMYVNLRSLRNARPPAVQPLKAERHQTLSQSADDEESEKVMDSLKKYLLFYGGGYKSADGNASRPLLVDSKLFATIAEASRKDVRNAVEAAQQGQLKWEATDPSQREQIMFQMNADFAAKKEKLSSFWHKLYESHSSQTKKLWNKSCDYLKFWAASCNRSHYSSVSPSVNSMTTYVSRRPLGVVALGFLDDEKNQGMLLLTLLWQVAAALCFGNAVVVVVDAKNPAPVLEVLKVIVSAVPNGVINVLMGNMDTLMTALADHQCVDAVFQYGGSKGLETTIVRSACQNMKQVLNSATDWIVSKPCCANRLLSQHLLTRSKAIWINKGNAFA